MQTRPSIPRTMSRNRNPWDAAAAVLAAAALGLTGALVAAPASAYAEAPTPLVEHDAIIDGSQIQLASLGGAQAFATTGRVASAETQARVRDYQRQQAQTGAFLDDAQTRVASVANPLHPGKQVELVWSSNSKVTGVHLHEKISGKGGASAANLATGPAPDLLTKVDASVRDLSSSVGSGFSGGQSPSNMYTQASWSGATTMYFDAPYGTVNGNQHQMNSNWQIFKQAGTVHWIYNRWATWTPAQALATGTPPCCNKASTVDFSILSRPWKTLTGRIASMGEVTPAQGATTCTETGSYTLSAPYGGVTGSVSIPMHKCATTWKHEDHIKNQFGMDWDGNSNAQLYLDAAANYNASDATVTPVWADQSYAEVHWCDYDYWVCGASANYGWKIQDSGW